MLTNPQFSVLACCKRTESPTQRAIVEAVDLSLGTVNAALRDLRQMELVDDDYRVTDKGTAALEPYRVKNAVIMAAGMSTRFAPISYEKPKGVLTVLGEVLVERQIRQLKEAGIDDITLVLGYKKEEFFYLEEMYGCRIVINDEYATRNNNSTIKCVERLLDNTYICSSDDYFTENPFELYVYESYYSAVFEEGPTNEYCIEAKGKDQHITKVTVGGENSWIMLGHVYWDRSFSRAFCDLLDRIYDEPATAGMLWEDIYIQYLRKLPEMAMRKYRHGIIWEFDSLAELREFDPDFLDNVDSAIMDNICDYMKCKRSDICGIVPIKQGLTNLSFRFTIDDHEYVYRHPGFGTDAIISRKSESMSQKVAADLGIDTTFIYEHPEEGWKISHFIDNAEPLDYQNWDHIVRAMDLARKLHNSNADTGFLFDLHGDTLNTISLLDASRRTSFKDFDELFGMAERFNKIAKEHGERIVLCHNDFYSPNFLIKGDRMDLIDWEYSGMSDYSSDICVFICCCEDYVVEDALRVFDEYFEHQMTDEQLLHCMAYLTVVCFHWLVWALYQDMCGSPVGSLLYTWYKDTKLFGRKAEELAAAAGL